METRLTTRNATREYGRYSETPWTLWETMYARRSTRKYVPSRLDDETASGLAAFVEKALRARGASSGGILVVTDPGKTDEVRKGAYKGMHGKINLWLIRAPTAGFLALVVPDADVRSDRPSELPRTVMAAEDGILWLTERGLGTCWLGGIGAREVASVLELGSDMSVPALVSIGRGKPTAGAVRYDDLMYRVLSRRRRPLSEVAYEETTERPHVVRDPGEARFEAAQAQDLDGLLDAMGGGGGGDVPEGLAVEACLEAARIAPSGGNAQKWHFVAVLREERLRDISSACGAESGWRFAIVGLGESGSFSTSLLDKPFWMIDVPIALSHASLMAASMGLRASVHTDIFEGDVNRLVAAPDGVRAVGVVGVT